MTPGPAVAEPGLRERKKAQTRAALRSAAIRLFRERGPAEVTVEDICAEVGVSPRTFFNYFDAKEEVLVPFSRDDYHRFAADVAERPAAEEPQEAVREVLGQAIARAVASDTWRDESELLRAHPHLLHRVAAANRSLRLALTDGLLRRLGAGAEPMYADLVAAASVAATQVAVNAWQNDPDGADVTAVLAAAFDTLHRGLAPAAERCAADGAAMPEA